VTIILKKCPFCNWTLLAERGDRMHPHCSTEKPKETVVERDVITKLYSCRNPKCLKPITVYYYNAKQAFKLI
jgi:hypothetical protein